jgi:hypothetical protein
MPRVAFDGGEFELEEIQDNPARYVRGLERAKINPGYAHCLCVPDAPRRLVIRRYGTLLHLAGWPDDGHRHKPDYCPFHKSQDEGRGSAGGDSKAAILATPLGLNVKLDVSLVQRDVTTGSSPRQPSASSRSSRRSAGLLGFLQALWCAASLNRWSGTTDARNWGACNAMLLAGLGEHSLINGAQAERTLHIMRRFEEADREAINAEFDTFLAGITNEKGTVRRGIVIGEINEITQTQYGRALSLRQSGKKYFASAPQIAAAAEKFAHAWRAIGQNRARVIAIIVIERTPKAHLRLVDLAAMLCSRAFIPCDSIHEVDVANRLVAEHRSFIKPVRMADGDDMLPDFELTDTSPRTHIEVYGMNGVPAYEARKAEKQQLRRQRQIPAVEWDVDKQRLADVVLPSPVK